MIPCDCPGYLGQLPETVTPSDRALAARDDWLTRNGGEDAIKWRMTRPLTGGLGDG